MEPENPQPPPPPLRPRPSAALVIFCLAGVATLALLPFVQVGGRTALFVGRLHPSILHFPVALIVLTLLFDVTRLSWIQRLVPAVPEVAVKFVLRLAAATAFVAAIAGWLLSHEGGYDGDLLERHLYSGIATAIATIAAVVLRAFDRPERALWRRLGTGLLAATCGTMIFAAHAGAALTHGEDYLTEYAPDALRRALGLPVKRDRSKEPVKPLEERDAFADIVLPVFEDRCISCHNEGKRKGNLRLDVHGEFKRDEMLRRLRLPLDDGKHMPPKGKPQLTDDEIAIVEWWVRGGAPEGRLAISAEIRPAIVNRLPESHRRVLEERKRAEAAALEATLAGLRKSVPGTLSVIVPGAAELEFSVGAKFDAFQDADLEKLRAIGRDLRWLDLARSGVTDGGLGALAGMPGLVRLDLRETALTDAGLRHVAGLETLEVLTLFGTKITDAGLEHFIKMKNLRKLYVSYTGVTEAGEKKLREALPQLEIVR